MKGFTFISACPSPGTSFLVVVPRDAAQTSSTLFDSGPRGGRGSSKSKSSADRMREDAAVAAQDDGSHMTLSVSCYHVYDQVAQSLLQIREEISKGE